MTDQLSIHDRIIQRFVEHYLSGPLIQNDYRGIYVEEMVVLALEPDWRLCASEWAGWDLENGDGFRVEVKQSSALQTWQGKPYIGSFGIAPSKGYWEGARWIAQEGRLADIYVMAWHPITDESCDHRAVGQWRFFVVPATELPPGQKSISRKVVERRWGSVGFDQLKERVADVCEDLLAL